MKIEFPRLDVDQLNATRNALQAYSKIPGAWLRSTQSRRKHWWHISLRPSLNGLTTGVIYSEGSNFEIELNLIDSLLTVDTSGDSSLQILLAGQAAANIDREVREFLLDAGIPANTSPEANIDETTHDDYSALQASNMQHAVAASCAVLTELRAGLAEETSPLGLWPHHFDLAMLWLPGDKIPGQDPDDEEYSDKQMNFGFTFGDAMVSEPYYYVTAYPTPENFAEQLLGDGAEWLSDGFTGMIWRYTKLTENKDPGQQLLAQMQALLVEGKNRFRAESKRG